MPAVARSKLCSSASAWLGVFASIVMSSAQSASVIVFAGYLLFLYIYIYIYTCSKRRRGFLSIGYRSYRRPMK